MDDFRFEKLDIWNESMDLSDILFDYCDRADELKRYKFSEQLRSTTISIASNIAKDINNLYKIYN
jgi:four helix bundle protein